MSRTSRVSVARPEGFGRNESTGGQQHDRGTLSMSVRARNRVLRIVEDVESSGTHLVIIHRGKTLGVFRHAQRYLRWDGTVQLSRSQLDELLARIKSVAPAERRYGRKRRTGKSD